VNDPYHTTFDRVHGSVLGSGVIRQNCADFMVKEILGFDPSGTGEHVYLQVRKVGANTGWVAERLADFLNLRHFDVGYAGKKDRHATTEQWFSCWLPGKVEPDWKNLKIEGVELLQAVRHERKLRRGAHAGNFFSLRIRDLVLAVDRPIFEKRLAGISEVGFPNYFGPQRFGHDSFNLVQADLLFKGKKLSRKRRDMVISAARSYLFNRELSAWLNRGELCDREFAWLFGRSPHRDIEIPDLEFDLYDDDIDRDNWCEGLINLGIRAAQRELMVIPGDLNWELHEDSLDVSFTLPNGAYATSLLRELIDYKEPGFD